MALRLIGFALLFIWLVLVLFGKGGFVHLLFFNGIGVLAVDLAAVYRSRFAKPI
ncbi:MAG: hypothetical protein JO053_09980 [Acidobacteria bacterium]|nr:hypothetical protein [Acidobacteriota bacterium]